MLSSWLLVMGLSAVSAERDLADYEAARAATGRNAAAQVRLALWCEAHGLSAERIKHLALAVLTDPNNVKARGLLGLVEYRNHWDRPESISRKVQSDQSLNAKLAEYNARRGRGGGSADDHWRLALWCEEVGLEAEARAHFTAVTRIDPSREAAWKRLGCKKVSGRWLTEDQIAAESAELKKQQEGARRWRPLLSRWRRWLADPDRREATERALAGVSDPYAAASVLAVFGGGSDVDQGRAVQVLGQIEAPIATRALAILSIASLSQEVRRAACETLGRRNARSAAGLLVALLRDPEPNPETVFFRIGFVPVGALAVGSPGISVVETRGARLLRFYTVDESFRSTTSQNSYQRRVASQVARQLGDLETDARGVLAETMLEVIPVMATIRQRNERVMAALRSVTHENPGEGWEDWARWWVEGQGYAYDPEPFRSPPDYSFFDPKPVFSASFHLSCFAAGTPVATLTGRRPIEFIEVGDQVLSQDTTTGRLSFAPVLAAIRNQPTATLRIQIGDEAVVATRIHRFWKSGNGWIMARDLKTGDAIRTVGGTARVGSVESDSVRPVFNLEVGPSHNYFVGNGGGLVHDNSVVLPVAQPFDAEPTLATMTQSGR